MDGRSLSVVCLVALLVATPIGAVTGGSSSITADGVASGPTADAAVGHPPTAIDPQPRSSTSGATVARIADPTPTPSVTLTVERVSETTVAMTVVYHLPESVDELRVAHGDLAVLDREGFERCRESRLCWDGSERPTVTLRYDLGPYEETYTGTVDPEQAFVPAPRVYTIWRSDGTRRIAPLFAKAEYADYAVTGTETVVGNATLYLGPHVEHRRTIHGRTFRLIVPENVTLGPSPEDLFDVLGDVAVAFDVGGENREVILVALEEPPHSTEYGITGAAIGNAFWARADSPLTSTHNVWLHEYVHTRQRFGDRDRTMEWFVEASAEYYAARLSYESGLVGHLEYEWELKSRRVRTGEDVLAEPSTWEDPNTPYRKGTLVLAALDAEIREATDGERMLEDVVRRLNRPDRKLTYEAFVAAVVAVSDDPALEAWLDRYVRGTGIPRYEPRDPNERLPNPPRMDEVASIVPNTPLGFAFGTLVVFGVSMIALSALSLLGRNARRTVGVVLDTVRRTSERLLKAVRRL